MSAQRPRVLIVSFTRSDREPRVIKQIAELRHRYHVTTAGFGPAPAGVDDHIELDRVPPRSGLARIPGIFSLMLLLRMHRQYVKLDVRNRDPLRRLKDRRWDVVVAHDAQTLYLASLLAPTFGVLADLHEYSPRQNAPSLRWNLLDQPYYSWLCRTFATKANAVTTVSPGIVDEYRREFGIEAELVVNATPYRDIQPSAVRRPLRLVHSGGAAPDRKLETLIAAVKASTADVTLDFYLVDDDSGYLDRLRALVDDDERIRFQDPVSYDVLVGTLAQYDLGLHVIAPTSFNNHWSLPNKFFDFVQARLGVVIGPSPAMVEFVERYGFGAVADGFTPEALTAVLDTLTPERVEGWKAAAHRSARELSGEEQAKIWGRIVDRMVSS